MIRLAAILLLLAALPAPGAASSGAAEGRMLRLTKADCVWLVKHRPTPDVAYRPGIDIHGRPVAPADLGAPAFEPPETLVVPITVDLRERFGTPADSTLFKAEVEIGRVLIEGDRISIDGRPLAGPEILALGDACRRGGTTGLP